MGAAPTILRLLRAKGADQRTLARHIVARGLPWQEWIQRFNEAYRTEPELGERAARALEEAARAHDDGHAAARLRVMRGTALQRSGSPEAASRLLLDAEPILHEAGDHDRAAQAIVLAVDALGHAGEIDEALRCADRGLARIRGPHWRLWRAGLKANRANVLRLAGRLDESARDADVAARGLDALGEHANAAAVRMNAGVALMYAGRLRQARRRFDRALEHFEEAGHDDRALEVRYNLACLDVRDGRLGAAIPALEALAAGHGKRRLARREALCRMDLSDALRRAGDVRSAASEAEKAARLFEREGAGAEAVEARWVAAAAAASFDGKAAAGHVRRARDQAVAAGRAEFELRCDVLLHDLRLRSGKPLDGRALLALRRRAERLGQMEIAVEARLLAVESALAKRAAARARTLLEGMPSAARSHPWLRVAAETAAARVDTAQGDTAGAIRTLRALTRRMDRIRGGLPGAWLRTMFLFERLDPYLALVDALLVRGRAPDRREAEEVLDALALGRFLRGRQRADVSRHVNRLRQRLERMYDRLADGNGPTRGLNPAQRARLLGDVRRIEREVAEAWRTDERRRTGVTPHDREAERLSNGSAFVHVWTQDGALRALVRRAGVVRDAGVLAPVDRVRKWARELSFHAQRVRLRDSTHARAACDATLQRLSDHLLPGLALSHFGAGVRLVLDPRLPDLPWELLPTGDGRPLAVVHSVARVPAVRLPRRRLLSGSGMTVIAAGETGLAGISREALRVSKGARLLRGPAARRDRVTEALCSRRVVHLAMHGVAAPDAPALGGVRLADGWFTAADVPERVATEVVSLAACQTGTPQTAAGRAWGAIPYALLRSGTRWVIWTSADVDDETTADLMSAFYPLGDMHDVPDAFGRALAQVWERRGTPAGLLPFHLSGGQP